MEASNYKSDDTLATGIMQRQRFQFEPELAAISYHDFSAAIERLPYGHVCRVALQLLAATGCRITELDKMNPANLLGNELFWTPGKNQKGLRREFLPGSLVGELAYYRLTQRTRGAFLLGVSSQTVIRYFDRDCRPLIGGAWNQRTKLYLNGRGWVEGWRLHLKGFRKTFQTVLFAYFYEKYSEAGIAAEWVAKRMRHSTAKITIKHYINDHTVIETDRWLEWYETGTTAQQRRLIDYGAETI